MEQDEDQPVDVRNASPVEEEIKRAENDDQSTHPAEEYESKRIPVQKFPGKALKRLEKTAQIKEDHCAKKLKRKTKDSKGPVTVTVLVNEKPCVLPKIDLIPRHCLSKKEWIDLLATPSRKCPPPCRKKEVERKLRPVSLRINELALPTRQRMMTTLQDRGNVLPAELVDRLINILEGETCLTPEQAERLFRNDSQNAKRTCKIRKSKCKTSAQAPKKSEVSHSPCNKDAVGCQYLMAEAFVKSLLQWKCTLPKAEFKDIADIIIKRLSTTLEYTPVDNADRTTQQMKFLADIIAAWIAGILFEVAESHKEDLEKECEERKKMKEEEETEDDTEESEEQEFIPQKIEDSKSLKAVETTELKEDTEKEDEKSEDGEDGDKTPKDDNKDNDGNGGAGGVSEPTEPSEDYPEPPADQGRPTQEETELSPDEESQEETKPSPDEAPQDNLDSLLNRSQTDLDIESSEGDGKFPPLSEEPPIGKIPLTTYKEEDDKSVISTAVPSALPPEIPEESPDKLTASIPAKESEDKKTNQEDDTSVIPIAVPSALPPKIPEESPDKSTASIPVKESAIGKEIDGKESQIGTLPDASNDAPLATPESIPAIPGDVGDTPFTVEVSAKDSIIPAMPQATPSEQLMNLKPSDTLDKNISTIEAAKLEVESSTEQISVTPIPIEQPEDVLKEDASLKNLGSDITAKELSTAKIPSSKYPSSLPFQRPQRKAPETEEKDSDFIEGNLRKMLQTDVPFLDLIKIFDRIENAVSKEKENQGEDLMTDRIHRAIYEKFERLVKAETPERWTAHLQDVLDVLSGKIAQWVRNILTDSEILFLNENPPMVESGELRNFGKWIGEMSERANGWTVWMQNMINELMKMQPNQVTRIDWQNWTRNFAEDALKWRRYYLESVHYVHHNRTMLSGREVVKTGEMKYPEWSIQEREIETLDLLQE
ncbi:FK506-binding protein 5 [Diachasma alloeum]|uniref:FK506-binding protein 5 n=1 Tax=Diachasma alloeum TaxID=454923 RepID=UPI0007382D33|nr:FK506-binding protein 5 [Diachasma alloeum]